MSTNVISAGKHQIVVNGLPVAIDRKAIKNLHLGVYPPEGRVRVAAPLAVSDEAVRLAVVEKLGWIKRQQAKFAAQARQSEREMENRESHYFLGKRYLLRLVPHQGTPKISLNGDHLELHIRPNASTAQKERVLQFWYRRQLEELIPPLLEKWQPLLSVEAANWSIRKMKTKWGTCNHKTGCIRFNVELAKKPLPCLEYIVVHELLHLIEPKHNDRFIALQNTHLPHWKLLREELNSAPLGHESWSY